MLRYILRRLLELIPTLFAIITLSFFLMRLAPGGPFDSEKQVPREVRENLERRYHMDDPLWLQYGHYLADVARFDLGPSFKYKDRTVNEIIANGFPVSLKLGLSALLFAMLIGIAAGTVSALRQNRWQDHLAMGASMVGVSLPSFVLGPLLILVFALWLGWLPAGRWEGPSYGILPALTLGAGYAAYVARLTRGGLLEVVRQDYVRTARAKGLPERLVVGRHAFRGGLLPVVTFLGPALASLLTGSIVVERIFGIPGMGRYFVDAAINRDYTLAMGVVIVDSALLLALNLVVDVAYAFLDPRIRHG